MPTACLTVPSVTNSRSDDARSTAPLDTFCSASSEDAETRRSRLPVVVVIVGGGDVGVGVAVAVGAGVGVVPVAGLWVVVVPESRTAPLLPLSLPPVEASHWRPEAMNCQV